MVELSGSLLIPRGYSFTTPYFLVYGTLRKDESNYKRYLDGFVAFHGTYVLRGWAFHEPLSGIYTGRDDDHLVVDLMEVPMTLKDPRLLEIAEINFALDRLEGVMRPSGYEVCVLDVNHPDLGRIFCKIYQGSPGKRRPSGDFKSRSNTDPSSYYQTLQVNYE